VLVLLINVYSINNWRLKEEAHTQARSSRSYSYNKPAHSMSMIFGSKPTVMSLNIS
jgi:hypothetical protein